MKDYFSTQSKAYATFRPTYPDELYEFIFQHIPSKENAWDCATGNGQVAQKLAQHFRNVEATDISTKQLEHAIKKENIHYATGSAEKTAFSDHQFDLITVAQALHWFDREAFYKEVRRVCKPGGVLAVWGYSMLTIDPRIDKHVLDFYNNTVGPYWDSARRLVEDEYRSIEFPFEIIHTPSFAIKTEWTIDQLSGYFSSWSATQKFIKEKGYDPVVHFIQTIKRDWEPTQRVVSFPLFTRIAIVK
jgi:ubiquinone/menaquinone biosynthesis C-methylase UbiE